MAASDLINLSGLIDDAKGLSWNNRVAIVGRDWFAGRIRLAG